MEAIVIGFKVMSWNFPEYSGKITHNMSGFSVYGSTFKPRANKRKPDILPLDPYCPVRDFLNRLSWKDDCNKFR